MHARWATFPIVTKTNTQFCLRKSIIWILFREFHWRTVCNSKTKRNCFKLKQTMKKEKYARSRPQIIYASRSVQSFFICKFNEEKKCFPFFLLLLLSTYKKPRNMNIPAQIQCIPLSIYLSLAPLHFSSSLVLIAKRTITSTSDATTIWIIYRDNGIFRHTIHAYMQSKQRIC